MSSKVWIWSSWCLQMLSNWINSFCFEFTWVQRNRTWVKLWLMYGRIKLRILIMLLCGIRIQNFFSLSWLDVLTDAFSTRSLPTVGELTVLTVIIRILRLSTTAFVDLINNLDLLHCLLTETNHPEHYSKVFYVCLWQLTNFQEPTLVLKQVGLAVREVWVYQVARPCAGTTSRAKLVVSTVVLNKRH